MDGASNRLCGPLRGSFKSRERRVSIARTRHYSSWMGSIMRGVVRPIASLLEFRDSLMSATMARDCCHEVEGLYPSKSNFIFAPRHPLVDCLLKPTRRKRGENERERKRKKSKRSKARALKERGRFVTSRRSEINNFFDNYQRISRRDRASDRLIFHPGLLSGIPRSEFGYCKNNYCARPCPIREANV